MIYIYLFLKSNTSSLIPPCSLAVPLSTSLSTSHQARYLKEKVVGPTCGHEPRAHSTCQLPSSFLRLFGAYIVQNPNWYLNIIILLKTKCTNWQHLATKGLCTGWQRQDNRQRYYTVLLHQSTLPGYTYFCVLISILTYLGHFVNRNRMKNKILVKLKFSGN